VADEWSLWMDIDHEYIARAHAKADLMIEADRSRRPSTTIATSDKDKHYSLFMWLLAGYSLAEMLDIEWDPPVYTGPGRIPKYGSFRVLSTPHRNPELKIPTHKLERVPYVNASVIKDVDGSWTVTADRWIRGDRIPRVGVMVDWEEYAHCSWVVPRHRMKPMEGFRRSGALDG